MPTEVNDSSNNGILKYCSLVKWAKNVYDFSSMAFMCKYHNLIVDLILRMIFSLKNRIYLTEKIDLANYIVLYTHSEHIHGSHNATFA